MTTVTIPIRIESEPNVRCHWAERARRTREHRGSAFYALKAAKAPFTMPVVITLTRIAPRELDDDNLRAGFKGLRDGIADWFQVNDRTPLIRWEYAQRRGEPKQYAAEVKITPATSATEGKS